MTPKSLNPLDFPPRSGFTCSPEGSQVVKGKLTAAASSVAFLASAFSESALDLDFCFAPEWWLAIGLCLVTTVSAAFDGGNSSAGDLADARPVFAANLSANAWANIQQF